MTKTPGTTPKTPAGGKPAEKPAGKPEGEHDHDYVRPAGPEEMEDKPKDWDIVDEESDESFPASDPPSNY